MVCRMLSVRVSGLRSAARLRARSRSRESPRVLDERGAQAGNTRRGKPTQVTSAFPVRRWSERRVVVLTAAVGLFAAVFALRQASADGADATELLYVIPISLVALELGLLAGVGAAVLALGLVGIWTLSTNVSLDAVGMFTRGVAFLPVGIVAGQFADRMRDAGDRQHLLLQSGLTLAHLTGSDDLPATLAHQARELVACRGTRVELTGRPPVESGPLGDTQEQVAIEARGTRYGTLTVSASRPINAEDRAALTVSVPYRVPRASIATCSCVSPRGPDSTGGRPVNSTRVPRHATSSRAWCARVAGRSSEPVRWASVRPDCKSRCCRSPASRMRS